MKKLLLLTLFVFISSINAQSYDDASEASELCLLSQGSIDDNFINDKDAEVALDKILSVIGASKRFILQPCSDINNAVATSYKGLRYILYDKSFMSTIANNSTSWSQLFILAHEVGHHINGHSIDILLAAADIVEPKTLATKKKQELESDEFAGFILGKLGATLEQTSEAINLLASNKDDTYSTHTNKSKRLIAIKIGFNKA
jgi:Zn-dependent peptidase ImmA (M78 family)